MAGAGLCLPTGPGAAACAAGGGVAGGSLGAATGAAVGAAIGGAIGLGVDAALAFAKALDGGSGGGGAGRDETSNFGHTVSSLGLDKRAASEALHAIKKAAGLKGSDNVIFNKKTGDVLNQAGEVIGNLLDGP